MTTGLASAALAAGIPTLVVDLDPHADASTALGVRPGDQLDIGRMLKAPRRARLAENMVPSGWVERAARQRRVPPAPRARPGRGRRLRLHRHLRPPRPGPPRPAPALPVLAGAQNYELVLVDCPPSLNGLTRMAWSASDKVTLVAEPGPVLGGGHGTHHARHRAVPPGIRPEPCPRRHRRQPGAQRIRRAHLPARRNGVHVRRAAAQSPHIPEQADWQQIQGAAHSIHHWPGESAKNAAALFDALLANLLDTDGRQAGAPVREPRPPLSRTRPPRRRHNEQRGSRSAQRQAASTWAVSGLRPLVSCWWALQPSRSCGRPGAC